MSGSSTTKIAPKVSAMTTGSTLAIVRAGPDRPKSRGGLRDRRALADRGSTRSPGLVRSRRTRRARGAGRRLRCGRSPTPRRTRAARCVLRSTDRARRRPRTDVGGGPSDAASVSRSPAARRLARVRTTTRDRGLGGDLPTGAPPGLVRYEVVVVVVTVVEDDAVAEPAGQREGLVAAGAEQEGRYVGRRPVEPHVVEVDVATVDGDAVSVQQRADRRCVLAKEGQRRGGADAGLAHPVQHAVADRRREPAREHPRDRRDLHRGQRRVAEGHRHQAEPDADPRRPREGGRRGADAAAEEAVLPQPDVVDAGLLAADDGVAKPLGSDLRPQDDAEPGRGLRHSRRPGSAG